MKSGLFMKSDTHRGRTDHGGSRRAFHAFSMFAVIAGVLALATVGDLAGKEPAKTSVRKGIPSPQDIVRQERNLNRAGRNANVEAPAVGSDANRLLEAQLAAGEFGPAWETARGIDDPELRQQMFKQIAQAQFNANEFRGALAALRQIDGVSERREVVEQQIEQNPSLSGGSGADFTQLTQLIMQETSGLWEENGDGEGTISPYETGVRVDPNGLLRMLTREEDRQELSTLSRKARAADLNDELNQQSPLRMVSLTRLEREVSRRLAEGQPVVETMQHLAGLTEVKYVLIYPDEGEIVIAGSAEGWNYNERGQAVGRESGKPTLYLDDFVTVLRIFAPEGEGLFTCSINPREEGLKALKDYVEQSQARGPINSRAVSGWVRQLQNKLGLQDIVLKGVPGDSRVARVIVEADYRMKLIGIGRLKGPAGVESFFDLLGQSDQKNPPNLEALRWWLTMKYDAVLHSTDRNAFSLEGSSVLCQSENEFLNAQGQRVHTGQAEETNRLFAQKFTQNYAALAQHDLVFADLQNVFDLALVGALIHQERLLNKTGWDMGVFGPLGDYATARYEVPREVDSVVNHRVYNGKDIVVQVAGGVRGDLAAVVRDEDLVRESPRLGKMTNAVKTPTLPAGRWWWDMAGE